ncbi:MULTISPECIES: phage terminase small subunit P27 family [unclassified Cryobacterium]|uniref:phage terminase small subunit P27 family n=1 Tax=unclassified Cryobacterium TaxID=2649013 RepID=UPI0010695A28|nr:phage terminase small subunit P27 family [Cryobacterium sp. MDB2-A-1]TFC12823.1 phage terminase small subunit P27 family [Cryobacterium sp. MDB2-A-2]
MPRATAPAALRLIGGTGNGKDSGGRTVKPPLDFKRIPPEPPDWLSREALAEWERVVPEMSRLDILKPSDRAALAIYCENWATFVEASRIIANEGLTIEAKQGTLPHPAVGIARAAGREARTWAGQFGLTPAAENAFSAKESQQSDGNPFSG